MSRILHKSTDLFLGARSKLTCEFDGQCALVVFQSKPDCHTLRILVDAPHFGSLNTSFGDIGLVDAYCVDPEHQFSRRGTETLQRVLEVRRHGDSLIFYENSRQAVWVTPAI